MFKFGGGVSEHDSYGRSWSQDRAESGSESGGYNVGGSGAESQTRIAFEDTFARLFGGAEGAAAGLDPSMLTESANQLFSGGVGFLDQLSGGAGRDYLASRVSGENPLVEEQIAALSEDVGQLFREELNPAITAEAVGGGALGGGRQGVAQAGAMDTAAREFVRGSTALRSADQAARDAAAGRLVESDVAAAGTGLAGLTGLQGLSEAGFGAELAPYTMLSQILGGPTVLSSSSSQSFQRGQDFARAYSESFGRSESESRSTSRAKDVSFGFGS